MSLRGTEVAADPTTQIHKIDRPSLLSHVKYEHLIAGIFGGVASTVLLHPLDLIKVRLAVNDGRTTTPQYRSLWNAATTIFRQDGVRGLYRGVTPNVCGAGSSWGLYFLFYNATKTWVQGGNTKKALSPETHMLAASQAGILTLAVTNPIWVVKTRLCLQYSELDPSKIPEGKRYSGMMDALFKIYTHEGVRGLYKGFLPGIVGTSHGALQFMAYEEMKNRYNQYKCFPIDTKLTTIDYLTFAALSKLFAAATTYPYQVVRSRLQNQHRTYSGSWDCIKQTWTHEGARGFYKGLSANLWRVTPATMITFVVYENVSYFLLSYQRQ
uniref:Solute carrier family 25 member 32 n=1 Tax=Timema tahoe TaxID=61484 RepID=A0A7R9IDG0_9NEOP|nr:unnamed protein product [Timema tahoe]